MLAHHAEQVVLGMREELLGLRARETVLALINWKRRITSEVNSGRIFTA
jgi:hypothetical protein